jgi:hypothetical protein
MISELDARRANRFLRSCIFGLYVIKNQGGDLKALNPSLQSIEGGRQTP